MLLALLLGLQTSLAARLPTDYREALFLRAATELEALNAIGRFDEAAERGKRFAVLPHHQSQPYEVAFAYNRMAKLGDATRWYDRAIEADPTNAAACYDRGELRLVDGDVDGAAEDFAAAAAQRPDHWVVHFRLAQVAGRRGQPDEMLRRRSIFE